MEALAAAGANVTLVSRKDESLREAVRELSASGLAGELFSAAGNAGDPEDARRCVAAAVDRFGALDIVVNNAATNPYMGPLNGLDYGPAEKTFRVNQFGPIAWTRAAIEAGMGERDGGAVINVTSIGGMRSESDLGFYNTTKAALIHLTAQLAFELGPRVRVNAVAPGLVKTEMARALWEPAENELADVLPLRRLGEPEDIAAAIVFLCGESAAWITGQTLVVDGGALALPGMR